MIVEIISCEDIMWWYSSCISQRFQVTLYPEENPHYLFDYKVVEPGYAGAGIRKSDCKIIDGDF